MIPRTLPLLLLTLCLAGCFGQQVRNRVAPSLLLFADPIIEVAVRDPDADPEVVAQFRQALVEKRWDDALVTWPLVQRYAETVHAADARDGALGPGPSESAAEELVRFDSLLRKQAAR